jgi:hypothetical protein
MRRLTLLLFFLLSSALAHEGLQIESGSLAGAAQSSAMVFVYIFAGVLLVSVGGLIYSLLSARGFFSSARVMQSSSGEAVLRGGPHSSPHSGLPSSAPKQSKTPWPLAFGLVALLSSAVLAFGVQNYLALQNPPIFPTAVLYKTGWQVSYGRGVLEKIITVPAGQISYLHLSTQLEGKRLELPELGLRLPLVKGQQQDVQFVALRAGEYRSSSTPPLIIRSLEPQDYAAFVRQRR